MASGSAMGTTTALPPTATPQPAATPSQEAAWPGESTPPPPDDDRLAERLAQLLRREALRDGIDLSEIRS
jgi:pyruvate/2-oxoglutarate dehydrogenase complex dihydrolipoamide acyltransferase (E2) component